MINNSVSIFFYLMQTSITKVIFLVRIMIFGATICLCFDQQIFPSMMQSYFAQIESDYAKSDDVR
jgi:hypothetical protein